MLRLPNAQAFRLRVDLVLMTHGIDAASASHATEGLDVLFTGVIHVERPLTHERTCAPRADSRVERLTRRTHSMS